MIEPQYIVFFEDDAEVLFSTALDTCHVDTLAVTAWYEMDTESEEFEDEQFVQMHDPHDETISVKWEGIKAIKEVSDISIKESDKRENLTLE